MKFRNGKIARTIVSTLLSLLFAAASFAATKPLSGPMGIALDSKGNVYVANSSGNEVLVYSTNYVQIKSITKSLDGPTGVAFDPSGNLWVSNINSSTINEYSPTDALLQQLSNSSVNFPDAISIDGIGNLWVQNNDDTIHLFSPSLSNELVNGVTASSLQVNYFLGIATHGSQWALGTDQGFEVSPIELFLLGDLTSMNPVSGLDGNSLAFDASGNLYVGNLNGTVDYYNVTTKTTAPFAGVGDPKGIVVDNTRSRVYISDFINNDVQVYSTSGTLLTTIK